MWFLFLLVLHLQPETPCASTAATVCWERAKALEATSGFSPPAEPASKRGGGNAALYQQCSFLPTHTGADITRGHARAHGGNHEHARDMHMRLTRKSSPCPRHPPTPKPYPTHPPTLRQRQCETEETQWRDCASGCVGGSAAWGPYCRRLVLLRRCWGFPASVAYIWKRMEMMAPSRFMNAKGHIRAAICDIDGQRTQQFSLLHLWKENEHLNTSMKRYLYTGIFTEAPSWVMYSLSYKISTLTTAPPIAGATSTRPSCSVGFAAVTGRQSPALLGMGGNYRVPPSWQQFITNLSCNHRILTLISKDILTITCGVNLGVTHAAELKFCFSLVRCSHDVLYTGGLWVHSLKAVIVWALFL